MASPAALERQLEAVRGAGHAIDDEETAEGMHCFGAPVFRAGHDEAVAAVAVSLIKASSTAAREAEVVAAITALALDVSRRLGIAAPGAGTADTAGAAGAAGAAGTQTPQAGAAPAARELPRQATSARPVQPAA